MTDTNDASKLDEEVTAATEAVARTNEEGVIIDISNDLTMPRIDISNDLILPYRRRRK